MLHKLVAIINSGIWLWVSQRENTNHHVSLPEKSAADSLILGVPLEAWLSSLSHGLLYFPGQQVPPLFFPIKYNIHPPLPVLINFCSVHVHLSWISYRVWLLSLWDRQANLGLNSGSAFATCGTLGKSLSLSGLNFLSCEMVMIIPFLLRLFQGEKDKMC